MTSIIDDTERPPPDLVKQTLKMFEASANRRPRAAQRSNGVGGVASKVANYKTIIAEQKPCGNNKRDSTGAGSGAGAGGLTVQGAVLAASTPLNKQSKYGNVVPDIIPRQLEVNSSCNFDSPVTTLSKMLGRMQLETEVSGNVGGIIGGGSQRLVSDKRSQAADENEDVENDNDNEDNNEVHEADVDDDSDVGDNNDNGDDEGDDDDDNNDVCNSDKLGAAGDKLTPAALSADEATPAAAATAAVVGGGSVQRSFATAAQENAHVLVGVNVNNSRIGSDTVLTTTTTTATTTKQIGVIRPLLNQSAAAGSGSGLCSGSASSSSTGTTTLTSREIEKNRINEMKKSTALAADAALAAAAAAAASASSESNNKQILQTSLDTVINTNNKDASETDAAASVSASVGANASSGISPIWPHLRKRRQPNTGTGGNPAIGGNNSNADNNTSMVFNFSKSTKEVPDYIESDVVIYRRKRELPKVSVFGWFIDIFHTVFCIQL